MDRRQFVASLGVLAGGGAAAMGTGAFSSVQAGRDVSVSVADDSNAYLGIQPTDEPNGNYADDTGNGELAIELSGTNGNVGDGIAGGEGLNTNAITTMADVFEVVNQGTQTVELQTTPLLFYDVEGSQSNFEGFLGVFLVPQNLDFADGDGVYPVPPFMSFGDLEPGEALRFDIVGVAIPESAIGSVDVDDEVTFKAEV